MAGNASQRLLWAVEVLRVAPDDRILDEADLGEDSYDKIFAVHVAALEWPGAALDIARRRLAASGRLYLFSQAPGWKAPEQAEGFGGELGQVLARAGFAVDETLVKDLGTGFAAAVVGRASA